VLGYIARGEIKRGAGLVGGQGLATTGLVLGYVSLVVAIGGALLGILLSFLGVVLPFGLLGCSLCAGL